MTMYKNTNFSLHNEQMHFLCITTFLFKMFLMPPKNLFPHFSCCQGVFRKFDNTSREAFCFSDWSCWHRRKL